MKYKFGEIFHVVDGDRGANYPKEGDFFDEGFCLFLNAGNVTKTGWSFNKVSFITKEKDSKLRKGRVERGDTVLTTRGTVGNAAYYGDSIKYDHIRINSGMVILKAKDKQIIDDKFIYYLVTSPIAKKTIELFCSGSAQPQLPIKDFIKIKYDLPSLKIQKKIVSIIGSYDNLIENNNKRIRLLEQMAENLYKEWFVRFRFPGHEKTEFVNTKLGKLPTSFSVTNMNSVFEDYIGGGWGNDDESEDFPISASVIRGADFPNVWHYDVSTCPRRYHKKSNYKARQLQDGDIVMEISGGTSEQPVGRTVLVTQDMINRFEGGRVICASFCKMIRLKKEIISPYFFYFWMHYLYDTRIIDRYQLQSTGIINFKFEPFLKKGIVMLPPKELMQSFEDKINPIFKEINQLAILNDNLSRQRDLLLPRLMSGKLEV